MYVKTDVLLLADVFGSYRRNSYNSLGLDSLYSISGPGFSNRAMLKTISVEIKLIIDPNSHLIIKKGIRGGRCDPIYYHEKANNKYINPNFVKKEIKNHILLV